MQQYPYGWPPPQQGASPRPPAPHGAPPPPSPPPPQPQAPRRRGRRLVIAGLTAAGLGASAVAGVTVVVGLMDQVPVLDGRAVETGVKQVLAEYGTATPESITCPDGQEVRPGATFTCSVRNKLGLAKPVRIEITSAAGDYLVGKPG